MRVGSERRYCGDSQAGGVRAAHPAAVFQPLQLTELRQAGML